jgi:hypothetical protein
MKTLTRLLFFMIAYMSWMPAQSQQAKKAVQKSPVQLGDQYFAAGEYYTAAHLYGQYLNPPKDQRQPSDFPLNVKARRTALANNNSSRTDILYKQAESFRLANYFLEAAASYKECSEKDPSKYAEALYWYAVCERNLGHYSSAHENLKQYLNASGEKAEHRDAARKELETLNFIQQQLARPDSILFKTEKLNVPTAMKKARLPLYC